MLKRLPIIILVLLASCTFVVIDTDDPDEVKQKKAKLK